MNRIKTDICVIGGGSGGLSVAAGAVQMGADVVLVEKGKMGGDCLNYGCVPSKALLAAAKHAHAVTSGGAFGVHAEPPRIEFAEVHKHVHDVIAGIAPHDSVERFEGLGVKVIQAAGQFLSETELQAGDTVIEARRFVIATGSSAATPPIPGLEDTPYLTNETIFENTERPEKLLIIGGGPIGMEMAQAHRRLGSEVVVLEAFKALGKDDPELAAVVLDRLKSEGVDIREGVKIQKIAHENGAPHIHLEGGEVISGTHLLVAAGRAPNVNGMDLEKAGITYDRRGITVDAGLKTTNKKVYAIGDVAGGLQFTHMAGYHAGIVIRSALFRMPAKAKTDHIPWVTYTDPEMANVGLTEAQAREKHGDSIRVLRWEYAENDRARAERATEGLVKVITDKRGKILGAAIAGKQAGELIQVWALAVASKQKIGAMAGMVAPYPTLGEISKRAAGQYYTPKLFSERTKGIVRFLAKFG